MNDSALFASPIVIGALVALLAFVLLAFALGIARRRREEVRAALAALSAMKWREFAHHVAGVLAQRGLRQDDLDRRPGEDGFDIRMTRGAARYLVQCKQVGSHALGEPAVRDFAGVVRLQGAEGGILATTGGVDAAARRAASQWGIELLSGYQLWRQLRPLLPLDLVREIQDAARTRRARKALLAALVAIVVGTAAFLTASTLRPALPGAGTTTPLPTHTVPSPAAPTPAAPLPTTADPRSATAGPSLPAPPAATTPLPAQDAPAATDAGAAVEAAPSPLPQRMPDPTLTEQQLAARRAEAERTVRGIPGLVDARWSTRSTMVLTVPAAVGDALPEQAITAVCAALVRFEELRYTRLQVQPDSSTEAGQAWVRWRQCR